MTKLLMLGLALGFDSFRVSAGFGVIARDSSRDWRLASAFAVSDASALLLGLAVGDALNPLVGEWAGTAGPLLLAAYALYIVRLAWRSVDTDVTGPWIFIGLPLSLLGLKLGGSVKPLFRGRCQLAGGCLLLVAAVSLGLSLR
jgi:putative Mn2+ efflux pump MntP